MTLYKRNVDRIKIIKNVESSTDKRRKMCEYGVPRATYYRWLKAYKLKSTRGLDSKSTKPKSSSNAIPATVRRKLYRYAKQDSFKSGKEICLKLRDQGESITYQTVLKLLKNHQPPLYGRVVGWKQIRGGRIQDKRIGLVNNGYKLF
jgi:putative transposase